MGTLETDGGYCNEILIEYGCFEDELVECNSNVWFMYSFFIFMW